MGGFVDGGDEVSGEAGEEGEDGAGVGDAGEGDGVVEDKDGAVGVAEVFEGEELFAEVFGAGFVTGVDGVHHLGGEGGGDADAAGGEAVDAEVAEVDEGGLLTDAADDDFGVHEAHEFAKDGVIGGVFADDGVFDPGDEAVVDEGGGEFGGDVGGVLHVEDGGDAGFFDEVTDAGGDALGFGGEEGGEDHGGGELEVPEDGGLVHHGAVEGADGGDDEGVGGGGGGEEREELGVFADSDVVEVSVAAVEEDADAAGLHVADELGVLGVGEGVIGVAAERGDGDDGAAEVGGSDGGGLHRRGGF